MSKKFSIVREVWLGLGLTVFSLFFIHECDSMNQQAARYPRIILTILLLFSVALLIQGFYYSAKPDKYAARYGKSTKSIGLSVVMHPLIVFAVTAGYLALFNYANFFLATAIFVPVIMLIFGERKVLNMLLTTVGLEVFVYVVFVKLLNVYFPM